MNCHFSFHRNQHPTALSRRWFLKECGIGLGAVALHSLLGDYAVAAPASAAQNDSLAPKRPQFPGTTKRVIHLFMGGGPSHLDTWDPKPDRPLQNR